MNEPDLHCHRNPGVSPGDTEVAGLDVIVVGVGEAARDYWRDLLEMEGIGIRFCTGQHATQAALADMRPDALLFDASSPHDWLADLRRRPGLAGLPVVVLLPDSEAQPTDRLRIVAGGADDALATPLDDARVAATLRARVAWRRWPLPRPARDATAACDAANSSTSWAPSCAPAPRPGRC